MRLDDLAVLYGTDKGTKKGSGLTPKGYTLIYERLFSSMNIKGLLEIGVKAGASIKMWEDYFPDATIVGIDINEAGPFRHAHFMRGSQADLEFLSRIVKFFDVLDIVVDDGSHIMLDQIISLTFLFKYLRSGGLYIIEDLHAAASVGMLGAIFDRYIVPLATQKGPCQVSEVQVHPSLLILRKK